MKKYCLVLALTLLSSLSVSAAAYSKYEILGIFEGAWRIDSAKFELTLSKNTPLCDKTKIEKASISGSGTSSFMDYKAQVEFGLCKYKITKFVGKYSCFPEVTDFPCKSGIIEMNFNVPGGIAYSSLGDEYPGKKIIMSNKGYEKINFNHDISKIRTLVLFPKAWKK